MNMKTGTMEFEGHRIRIYTAGSGPTLLLLHGVGPGTSIPANFSAVTDVLAQSYSLVGMDLIGFGESSRKTKDPFFDFELWVRQAMFVVNEVRIRTGETSLRVWGHSLGGAIALRLAAALPFISQVAATGTGGGQHRVNPPLDKFWTFPESPAQLKDAMMSSMLDPAAVTDDLVSARYALLQQGDIGPYFARMMSGDKQALLDSARLDPALLAGIESQVLLIHGRDDKPCPAEENALYLSRLIPRCDAIVLGRCGHNPAREYPAKTAQLVLAHFAQPV
ncbi:MAG: Alpha/beta hydrolase fold protein [Herbaspirillum sp.]|jgi:2-hydroxymuconate-semialdehyde hydrolase|nr:Alpha/beta hydrolase fold protein [Herbaspirillum sp.]